MRGLDAPKGPVSAEGAFVGFAKGDTVIHVGRPEWGPGDIVSVEGVVHEGKPCQRLSVRFSRAGLKTLSTAFAELRQVNGSKATAIAEPEPASVRAPAATGVDAGLPAANGQQEMSRSEAEKALLVIPEEATDPFINVIARLDTTLGLYRFWDTPAGLLDWATVQTGLRDALAVFSRHDLEAIQQRFRVALDQHLQKLLRDARKADAKAAQDAVNRAGKSAKAALRRVDIGR